MRSGPRTRTRGSPLLPHRLGRGRGMPMPDSAWPARATFGRARRPPVPAPRREKARHGAAQVSYKTSMYVTAPPSPAFAAFSSPSDILLAAIAPWQRLEVASRHAYPVVGISSLRKAWDTSRNQFGENHSSPSEEATFVPCCQSVGMRLLIFWNAGNDASRRVNSRVGCGVVVPRRRPQGRRWSPGPVRGTAVGGAVAPSMGRPNRGSC